MANDPNQKQTLVEEGTQLTGTLTSSCPVVVNGTIDGEFSAPELTITNAGAVLGTIKVNKLQSDGALSGNIDAEDVYLAGTVKPSTVIKAKSLEVKLASDSGKKLEVMFGECTLDVGDEPTRNEPTRNEPTSTWGSASNGSNPPPAIEAQPDSSDSGGMWDSGNSDMPTNGKSPSIAPEA